MENPKLTPEDLTKEELEKIVSEICEAKTKGDVIDILFAYNLVFELRR